MELKILLAVITNYVRDLLNSEAHYQDPHNTDNLFRAYFE